MNTSMSRWSAMPVPTRRRAYDWDTREGSTKHISTMVISLAAPRGVSESAGLSSGISTHAPHDGHVSALKPIGRPAADTLFRIRPLCPRSSCVQTHCCAGGSPALPRISIAMDCALLVAPHSSAGHVALAHHDQAVVEVRGDDRAAVLEHEDAPLTQEGIAEFLFLVDVQNPAG